MVKANRPPGRRIRATSRAAAALSGTNGSTSRLITASQDASGRPVAVRSPTSEAGLAGQAELRCAAPGQLDAGRGQVDPDQGGPGLLGGPQAGPAVPAAEIGDDVARAQLQGADGELQGGGRVEGARVRAAG